MLAVFLITNLLNFSMVAGFEAVFGGPRFLGSFRSMYVTVLPVEVAVALLTAGIALIYQQVGVGAVGLLAVVLFIFQYLLQAGIQAYERGAELEKRTRELASLQVGLISTVLQTLSMRDAMTARHSAAVARYSREVARLLGLSEREQDLIHTAGLFHDIGKFIFPDSILVADRKLTEEEWEIVKLHPEQGAKLVRRIEGYGPVADIVLSHHEKVDGTGYPYRPQRRPHPARLAHPRGGGHLRRHDLTRLLSQPGELGRGPRRTPSRRRHPAGSACGRRLHRDDREPRRGVPPLGRGGLRTRAGVRSSRRGLRSAARSSPRRRMFGRAASAKCR